MILRVQNSGIACFEIFEYLLQAGVEIEKFFFVVYKIKNSALFHISDLYLTAYDENKQKRRTAQLEHPKEC